MLHATCYRSFGFYSNTRHTKLLSEASFNISIRNLNQSTALIQFCAGLANRCSSSAAASCESYSLVLRQTQLFFDSSFVWFLFFPSLVFNQVKKFFRLFVPKVSAQPNSFKYSSTVSELPHLIPETHRLRTRAEPMPPRGAGTFKKSGDESVASPDFRLSGRNSPGDPASIDLEAAPVRQLLIQLANFSLTFEFVRDECFVENAESDTYTVDRSKVVALFQDIMEIRRQ